MCTQSDDMQEEFVSEPIEPVEGTFDAAGMAMGESGRRRARDVSEKALVQDQMHRWNANDNLF